ncbi:hypothetical protein LSH36_338g01004 [Paralvinella palmiformis]|uniref:Transcription elongation factor Eaf N-terminal domain-containing protein n=1 Tax=Paralvinella palmiformis TaxID=53620 RepID=A0AAD9JGT0_9ANNE|nr:hypothetical protein LSH36_338g01004 [Paralvinella palmiformis]
MAESLGIDGEVRELKLGSSFEKTAPVSYHSIRYDFKPASVDKSQMATVDIGESNSVTVTVPHIEGSGVTNTVYKGNKRPSQKECILVIDHQTGEVTLEKLTSNIHLKKTRQESIMVPQRVLPIVDKVKELKSSPSKKKPISALDGSEQSQTMASDGQRTMHHLSADLTETEGMFVYIICSSNHKDIDMMSSSASSDSDSDDSERQDKNSGSTMATNRPVSDSTNKDYHSLLSVDLQLSESGSDSD